MNVRAFGDSCMKRQGQSDFGAVCAGSEVLKNELLPTRESIFECKNSRALWPDSGIPNGLETSPKSTKTEQCCFRDNAHTNGFHLLPAVAQFTPAPTGGQDPQGTC